MQRNRVLALAALSVAVLAVALYLVVGNGETPRSQSAGSTRSQIDWRFLGVGVDGRSLLVQPVGTFSPCERAVAETREAASGALLIEVWRETQECPEANQLVSISFPAVTAQLPAPPFDLGRGEFTPSKSPRYRGIGSSIRGLYRMPDVVGLQLDLACRVLRANGITDVTLQQPLSGPAIVGAQDPPGSADLRPWDRRRDVVTRKLRAPAPPERARLIVDSHPDARVTTARCEL